jgi:hypothetical protein
VAAEFPDDFGDFAGGDALDIHFGHGGNEGLLTAHAFFQGRGKEVDPVAHLRHRGFDRPDAGSERFGLEAIGMAQSLLASLIGLGLENNRTFVAHGLVKKKARPFRETGRALGGKELQNSVEKVRIAVMGHVRACNARLKVFDRTNLTLPP